MTWTVVGNLAGGIGLFLLGMHLMTEGLKIAAGQALRDILERSTATAMRGLLSGVLITSLVQSSSAVTVATIGFVNAGLMNLAQAVTVIYGSNIGTTATGWLVSLIGFNFDIKAFALPAIGIGMALRVLAKNQRSAALGETITGFGIFFFGIDVLKNAFAGLGLETQLNTFGGEGALGVVMMVGAGALFTVVMQSSSAAIAIVLTAASGDVVSVAAAAAMVIGANIGTTVTALLAVIGATSNAKRVAAAHVAFNFITGSVALALLPLILAALVHLRHLLQLDSEPVTLLALFHTTFNLLGVAIMWPLTPRLVNFLERRFRAAEEDEAKPRYLDRNIVTTPVLAMHALVQELGRISAIARRMAKGAISTETAPGRHLASDHLVLKQLSESCADFTAQVQKATLPESLANSLPNTLRVARYYSDVAELAESIAQAQSLSHGLDQPALAEAIAHFKAETVKLVELADAEAMNYAAQVCAHQLAALEEEYQQLKAELLRAGSHAALPIRHMVQQLDLISDMRHLAQQLEKGARYLHGLREYTPKNPPEPATGNGGGATPAP